MASTKTIIYQVLSRLYGNSCQTRKHFGTLADNGCGKFADFSPSVLKALRERGITHIWYTGVLRHASATDYSAIGIPRQHPAVVKGTAGSPYAVADYYDVCPDLAVKPKQRMKEFEQLINRTHRAGLKVVIDFVPNHVARQYQSIAKPEGVTDLGAEDDIRQGFHPDNNFYYCPGQDFTPYFDLYHGATEPYFERPAKATGNDCFHNAPGSNDWYETVKLNYGVDYYAGQTPSTLRLLDTLGHVPSTWQKMADILLYWAAKGVDAFRCDMAEMVPTEFWSWAIAKVKTEYPDLLFIGEVYNPQLYRQFIGAGFDYLYDKVGMYDTLRDVVCHRRPTSAISQAWQQTDDIRQHMLYFLENHDEQRIASDFFAADGAKAIPALAVCLLLNDSPFMYYMGQEYGERGMDEEGFSGRDGRTTIFDYWSVDTLVRARNGQLTAEELQLADTYQRLSLIARKEKTVSEGLSFDLTYANTDQPWIYPFLRKSGKELLIVAANFDDNDCEAHITIPKHAFDYLQLTAGQYAATELLTSATSDITLRPDSQLTLSIGSRSVKILKIS